jgi:hypothetical protein
MNEIYKNIENFIIILKVNQKYHLNEQITIKLFDFNVNLNLLFFVYFSTKNLNY